MTEPEMVEAMARYKFYHTIKLSDTLSTPGNSAFYPAQKLCLDVLGKMDLKGKRVLDIGCRDGLFSFAAERMGAAEVVGIDNDLSKPAMEFLIPLLKSSVKMHEMNVYDLLPETFGTFDLIIFPGVLYHLRYPFWALKAIRDVLNEGGYLLTETAIWNKENRNALLFCPFGGESPYEMSSCSFFNEKGLVDTLKSIGFETQEISYVPNGYAIKNTLRAIKSFVRTLFAGGHLAPIRRVTRGVLLSRRVGVAKDSLLLKYWEGTHDIHSTDGAMGTRPLESPERAQVHQASVFP
jgi:2-polyprenyl-3-methyl-5-hydroxy-6-metoxy-1,4-benzoquinol methylase